MYTTNPEIKRSVWDSFCFVGVCEWFGFDHTLRHDMWSAIACYGHVCDCVCSSFSQGNTMYMTVIIMCCIFWNIASSFEETQRIITTPNCILIVWCVSNRKHSVKYTLYFHYFHLRSTKRHCIARHPNTNGPLRQLITTGIYDMMAHTVLW